MMRIRNRRILPAVVASSECPLSRVTRNMALGRTSETIPSTSIACSFIRLRSREWSRAPRGAESESSKKQKGLLAKCRQAPEDFGTCPRARRDGRSIEVTRALNEQQGALSRREGALSRRADEPFPAWSAELEPGA